MSEILKVAFAGLRHIHITALYNRMKDDPRFEIVSVCESDAGAIQRAEEKWGISVTHNDFESMLRDTEFDILAVGDYFAIRGSRVIAGLKAGKHIICDKPLCTSPAELAEIRQLADSRNLKVGVMLDFRNHGNVAALKELIDSGRMGDIHAVSFGGQHPLMYGTRDNWYFEPGKHGGTINDIAIHGLDAVEYLTGKKISDLIAARTWNAFADKVEYFKDAAQLMFKLDDGCGIMADVSYFAPDKCGFTTPLYWRFTVWGRKGVAEFNYNEPGVTFFANDAEKAEIIPAAEGKSDYLEIFMNELDGKSEAFGQQHIFDVTETALKFQQAAEK